jgi:hypothetical protein
MPESFKNRNEGQSYEEKLLTQFPSTWRHIIKAPTDTESKKRLGELLEEYDNNFQNVQEGTEEFTINANKHKFVTTLLADKEVDSSSQGLVEEAIGHSLLSTAFSAQTDDKEELARHIYCIKKAIAQLAEEL